MVGDHACGRTVQIGSPLLHCGNNGEQLVLMVSIISLCTGQLVNVELYWSQTCTLVLSQYSAKCDHGCISLDDKITGEVGQ